MQLSSINKQKGCLKIIEAFISAAEAIYGCYNDSCELSTHYIFWNETKENGYQPKLITCQNFAVMLHTKLSDKRIHYIKHVFAKKCKLGEKAPKALHAIKTL